jgi:hypothetical protein
MCCIFNAFVVKLYRSKYAWKCKMDARNVLHFQRICGEGISKQICLKMQNGCKKCVLHFQCICGEVILKQICLKMQNGCKKCVLHFQCICGEVIPIARWITFHPWVKDIWMRMVVKVPNSIIYRGPNFLRCTKKLVTMSPFYVIFHIFY